MRQDLVTLKETLFLQMNGTLESGKKLVQALQEAKVDPNTGG